MLIETKDQVSTEIWTRIAGFRVQSANHYTMEPYKYKHNFYKKNYFIYMHFATGMDTVWRIKKIKSICPVTFELLEKKKLNIKVL